jgi:hypothetical protein
MGMGKGGMGQGVPYGQNMGYPDQHAQMQQMPNQGMKGGGWQQ